MTTLQKPRSQRVRLTQRDYDALRQTAHLRAVVLDDLAALLAYKGGQAQPLSIRTTRDIVTRWKTAGLAETHANPRGGSGYVTVTPTGADWVGSAVRAGAVAWRDLPHTLTTAAVAINVQIETGASWTSDDELRGQLPNGAHRPDGVALLPNGQTVAVEVERTTKTAARWSEIIPATIERFGAVAYYASTHTAPLLRNWTRAHLTADDQQRLIVRELGRLER